MSESVHSVTSDLHFSDELAFLVLGQLFVCDTVQLHVSDQLTTRLNSVIYHVNLWQRETTYFDNSSYLDRFDFCYR